VPLPRVRRFASPQRLVSYLDLNGRARQSGGQPAQRGRITKSRGVAAATGARRLGPQGAKLRGRTFSPTILLFAPGSTTPNTEPNDAKIGRQPPRR
jgi:hypothetical protein